MIVGPPTITAPWESHIRVRLRSQPAGEMGQVENSVSAQADLGTQEFPVTLQVAVKAQGVLSTLG